MRFFNLFRGGIQSRYTTVPSPVMTLDIAGCSSNTRKNMCHEHIHLLGHPLLSLRISLKICTSSWVSEISRDFASASTSRAATVEWKWSPCDYEISAWNILCYRDKSAVRFLLHLLPSLERERILNVKIYMFVYRSSVFCHNALYTEVRWVPKINTCK